MCWEISIIYAAARKAAAFFVHPVFSLYLFGFFQKTFLDVLSLSAA
jgi:hypothetical protein